MPNWAWFLAGVLSVHLFWGGLFVAWWLLLIRRSGEQFQQAVRDDCAAIRAGIARAVKGADEPR